MIGISDLVCHTSSIDLEDMLEGVSPLFDHSSLEVSLESSHSLSSSLIGVTPNFFETSSKALDTSLDISLLRLLPSFFFMEMRFLQHRPLDPFIPKGRYIFYEHWIFFCLQTIFSGCGATSLWGGYVVSFFPIYLGTFVMYICDGWCTWGYHGVLHPSSLYFFFSVFWRGVLYH